MQNQNELTDGKVYSSNDMVKLQCNHCQGCFECCQGMGESVLLNPYDVWQLQINLKKSFAELISDKLELNVVEGMILPNLKMTGPKEICVFLNENGRCSIHGFRPGICRLFPLGRQYTEKNIGYIFLKQACPKPNKTKEKIRKWLDIPEFEKNEDFLLRWHNLQTKVRGLLQTEGEETAGELNTYLLKLFFIEPYGENFYEVFEKRAYMAEKLLEKLSGIH